MASTLKAFACDRFALPLPSGHRFPLQKYELLSRQVRTALPEVELLEPQAASEDELRLAHDGDYVARVTRGELSEREVRTIGLPWSPQMVERSCRSVGGSTEACRHARLDGVALHLGGGTHHAFADRGQGYCVFNDVAVAVRVLRRQPGLEQLRVAIIDLDVHQGNGTAAIFAQDPSVFTLSLHGASNFPFRKETSDLDIGLPDDTGDDDYLAALDLALTEMHRRFAPEFLVYLSGADAHEDDRLGRLKLTTAGLQARDERVFDLARHLHVPIAVTMAGGYGRCIETTVEVHLNTVRAAFAHFRARTPRQLESLR